MGLQIFYSPVIRTVRVPLILSKVAEDDCLIPIQPMSSATLAILATYFVVQSFFCLLPWFSTVRLEFSFCPFDGLHLPTTFFSFLHMYIANCDPSRIRNSLLCFLVQWLSFSIYSVN